MKDFEKITVNDGVQLVCIPATRFKTNEIAIAFSVRLDEKTASQNAVLLHILSGCSKDYPNLTALNRKLAMLYGASISCFVSTQGNAQVLVIYFSSLDDRFAIGDEVISEEGIKLLLSLIFEPRLDENGFFYDEDIEREKRVVCEKLESELSDKRAYALRRLEEEMFRGEPYSVNAYGDIKSLKAVDAVALKKAYTELISGAEIQILTVGNADEDKIRKAVNERFEGAKRSFKKVSCPLPKEFVEKVKTVEERQAIKQGKLVLGFRVNLPTVGKETDSMRVFCDVFGGGPYSKLFNNVREKLSLCYYCSARYVRSNSSIIVQCGCEEENIDKAIAEILKQIEDIKNGIFEEEYKSSLKALPDSLKSVYDDSTVLLLWYLRQITDSELVAPDAYAKRYSGVSAEDVQKAASLLSLDTVYKLMGKEEE